MAAALCAALAACGASESRKEITETRTVSVAKVAVSRAEPASQGPPHPADNPAHAFAWQKPEGWVETSRKPMRLVSFKVGDSQEAECYISVLKGAAGGTELNINRWRGQMDRGPLAPEAIAGLATVTVLGKQVALVEVTGHFRSREPSESEDMLLGAMCELKSRTIFIKMVGPEATVRAEHDNFISFCESLE